MNNVLTALSLIVSLTIFAACADIDPSVSAVSESVRSSGQDADAGSGAAATAPLAALELDSCDEPTFADVPWTVATRGSFRFHYLPGTAAEGDLDLIAERRQRAYDDIRTTLGIRETPVVDAYLSPSRLAARAHHVGVGNARPGQDRYYVIYTGDENAYESVRYGHEITHILTYYLVGPTYSLLPFLSEGVAEYFDQASRDLHEAYAAELAVDSSLHVATFEDVDVRGDAYGRAGSFVQAFVDAYGITGLVKLIRATAVRSGSSCFEHDIEGCIDSARAIDTLMRYAVPEATGDSWRSFKAYWRTTVEDVSSYYDSQVSEADRREIVALIQHADAAMNDSDAAAYRATMEGFYCDWLDEPARVALAQQIVDSRSDMETTVGPVYVTGQKNYPTAMAIVSRGNGRWASFAVLLEHFPVGWRVTWSRDWR